MQLIRGQLASLGLTPARATALAFVHENPGCSQNDLGAALGINRASAMELTNVLVGLEAIERRKGSDRRSHALYLTPVGERRFGQFVEVSREVDEVISDSLSPADSDKLVELFAQISDSLDQALALRGKPDDPKTGVLEVQ
jgi:DNA-binding MarR family transcriptional regulator